VRKIKHSFIKLIAAAANTLVVVYFLCVVGVIALLNPARQTVSVIEKRELAQEPEFSFSALAEGSYTKGLSEYFADTFPLRDGLIKVGSAIKEHMGFRLGGAKLYGTAANETHIDTSFPTIDTITENQEMLLPSEHLLPPEQTEEKSSTAPVESKPEKKETPTEELGVRNGSVLTCDGVGFTLFGGTSRMGQWYGEVINAYGNILKDRYNGNMRVYNLVVPTAVEFNLPKRYQSMTNSQRASLDNIKSYIGENVEWVDIYDTLEQHKDEYLFFRTDHHWTSLGAYYAYCEFAKTAGFEPIDIQKLEKRTRDNFLGTLYAQTQDSKMLDKADQVNYYILPNETSCSMYIKNSPDQAMAVSLYGEYASQTNSYSIFLHGDNPVFVIDTDIKNGRKIAVVKESYGNAMIPFLAASYERVVVIDQRYLQKGLYQVLEQFGVNEMLFINNILAAHTPVRIQEIIDLPNRTYQPKPQIQQQEQALEQQ